MKFRKTKEDTQPIVFEVQKDYDEDRHGIHLIMDGIKQIERDEKTGMITETRAKKDLKLIYNSVIRAEEKGILKAFQLLDSDISDEDRKDILDYIEELRQYPEWTERIDIIRSQYECCKDMECL